MVKPKQGKSYVITFKDGSVAMLRAKTAEEAVMRARIGFMDAPVPDGEMEHDDPGVGCIETES